MAGATARKGSAHYRRRPRHGWRERGDSVAV